MLQVFEQQAGVEVCRDDHHEVAEGVHQQGVVCADVALFEDGGQLVFEAVGGFEEADCVGVVVGEAGQESSVRAQQDSLYPVGVLAQGEAGLAGVVEGFFTFAAASSGQRVDYAPAAFEGFVGERRAAVKVGVGAGVGKRLQGDDRRDQRRVVGASTGREHSASAETVVPQESRQ